jgi:hypothetical protein
MAGDIGKVVRSIAEHRKRPLFVLVASEMEYTLCNDVARWKNELKEAGAKEGFDVLIHSPGGVLSCCYRVARLLARSTGSWEALIPSLATSGATLICLGSSKVVMSDVAQLGPIDPQVLSKRREQFFAGERQSPLEAFQAVRYLREFALSSVDATMLFLLERQVAPRPAVDTAASFGFNLVQPILSQIEPYDLGALALDNNVAVEYCRRIARPTDSDKKTQREANFRDLVEKYPAHEFVIDREEASALNFVVEEPEPALDAAFEQLTPMLNVVTRYVGLVPVTEGSEKI